MKAVSLTRACPLLRHFASATSFLLLGGASSLSAADPATGPALRHYTYEVVNALPHDPAAFTQGLAYVDGALYETTGLTGRSSLRKVALATGEVLQKADLPPDIFGEGMTIIGDRIFQITWKNQRGFVYDRATFAVQKEFSYAGEGWGLATDGRELIMSDGTNEIRFIDPDTFAVLRTIRVFFKGQPLNYLNELEFIKGEIFANVWRTNAIVRIDPTTGDLLGVIDFSGLLAPGDYGAGTDVLNGIAYDSAGDRLFVTGKHWPKLFEVRLRIK